MSLGERWARHPQNVWLRKALFQIHLWTGIGIGLYVVLISVSGSAIVFRNDLSKALSGKAKTVAVAWKRLSEKELDAAVEQAYPGYEVTFVAEGTNRNDATEVWMERNEKRKTRLFDPYTGKDLGPAVPYSMQFLSLLIEFHTNLLLGKTGRVLNGLGAVLVTLLALSGAVVWWPGIQNWRSALTIRRETNWKRLNWDLHSAVGIWTLAFVLVWGITGIFVVFPEPFERALNTISPLEMYRTDSVPQASTDRYAKPGLVPASEHRGSARRSREADQQSIGDKAVRWVYYLHFGNFAGWGVKTIWVVFGLAPPFLFVTGLLMWWNRVLSKMFRRRGAAVSLAGVDESGKAAALRR